MKNKILFFCTAFALLGHQTIGTTAKKTLTNQKKHGLEAITKDNVETIIDTTLGKTSTAFPPKAKQKKRILFDYENEDLTNVINYIAAQMGINIILPQGTNAIKTKLSLSFNKKIRLKEAWDLLQTLLDVAGYSIAPNGNMFIVMPNTQGINQEPMPTYIGIKPELLPNNDQRIRYLYYLANLTITNQDDNELRKVLKTLLPKTAVVQADTNANALLIIDKASNINAAMKIIVQLDKPGFKEKMEIVPLRHSDAQTVASLLSDQLLKAQQQKSRYRLDAKKESKDSLYFSPYTKAIPVERTNSIILLGRSQAVNRIKDFIYKYIDVELESGKSILHVYQLQYLDAQKMAEVLNNVVKTAGKSGAQQARGSRSRGGAERFFDEVYIKADTPSGEISEQRKYYGGNKLVIAARNEDWEQIKELITELDKPQPQVLIEVLIADIIISDLKQLGATFRNPAKIPLPNEVDIQSGQCDPGIVPDSWTDPTTVQSDILRKSIADDGSKSDAGPNSIASLQAPGSMIISFADNDGKVFSMAQILKRFDTRKVLSLPHVIATHNKEASIEDTQIRRLRGNVSSGESAATIRFEEVKAELKLSITPRISSSNNVTLAISVNINEFTSGDTDPNGTNQRVIRQVDTIAQVRNEDILAIGGLTSTREIHGSSKTPILGDIPLLGWFFKKRSTTNSKTNLTVFIKPTIIMPRLRGGVGSYTTDYIALARNYSKEGTLFDSLNQPITRWFFKSDVDANQALDEFLAKDDLKNGHASYIARDNNTTIDAEITQKVLNQNEAKEVAKKPLTKKDQVNKIKKLVADDDNPFMAG